MRKVLFLCAVFAAAQGAWAQDAPALIEASRDRLNAATVQTRSRMVITAKDGSASERLIDQYSKDDERGLGRTVIVFQNPAAVRGTRFLSLDKADGGSDQWMFLPALAKVRRIASSEGSGSFMGTDLSYNDIASTGRDVNADTHKLLREEAAEGAACRVIESVPKDGSYQYGKMLSWIGKDNNVLYKMELYDKRGRLVKTVVNSRFEDVQGRLTAKLMTVTTVDAGTSTAIHSEIIRYDANIPESVFTTRYLETGKP